MRGNEMFYFPSYSLTSARPFGQGPQDLAALARTWAGLATFFGRVHDSQFDHDFEFLGYQTRFRPDQERDHPQSEGLKRDHGAFIVLGREMDPRAAGHKPQREAQLKSSLSDALVQNRASAKFLAAHRWQKKSMAEEVDAQLISWKPYARLAPPQRLSMATNVPTFRPSNDPARCAPNIAFCHDNRSQLNISHSCTQVLKPYRSDYKKRLSAKHLPAVGCRTRGAAEQAKCELGTGFSVQSRIEIADYSQNTSYPTIPCLSRIGEHPYFVSATDHLSTIEHS
jgi:hypothetical protein